MDGIIDIWGGVKVFHVLLNGYFELEEYFSFNRSNIKCRTALFLILLRDLVHCWFLLRDLLYRKYIVHLLH